MSNNDIPHVRLTIGAAEEKAALRVLRSGHLAAGREVAALEREIADLSGNKRGIALSSGTAALHAALFSLGVKSGDEVIIPSYVCQALLNAISYVGAEPRVVDIDISTFNISPAEIKKAISRRTKAIIVPHMFGLMADMRSIKKFGIPVVEDCAMAPGANIGGKKAGSFGSAAVFSFYATKMITGGEGGALTSSNPEIIRRAIDLREYDKKRRYMIRHNYKMSDLNAAVLRAQLGKLDSFIGKRRAIARKYDAALSGTRFILPTEPRGYRHVFAKYVIRTKNGNRLRAYLKRNGVQSGHGVVVGIHELLKSKKEHPNTEKALKTAVSLPIYPTLTGAEQARVIRLLRAYND